MAEELAKQFHEIDIAEIMDLLRVEAEIVHAPPLSKSVCSDPEDDKFLVCTVASSAKYIVTGDKQILKVSSHGNVSYI